MYTIFISQKPPLGQTLFSSHEQTHLFFFGGFYPIITLWNLNKITRSSHVGLGLVFCEKSTHRGSGLRHYLSPTYNAVLSSLRRQFNSHSHLGSLSPSNPHEGHFGQWPTGGPNVSARTLPHRVQKPATPLQLVKTEEASWMRGERS